MKIIIKWLEEQKNIMEELKKRAESEKDKVKQFYYEGRLDQIKVTLSEIENNSEFE